MWFRYLITFADLVLSFAIAFSALKFNKKKDKDEFIGALAIAVCVLSSAILMWR